MQAPDLPSELIDQFWQDGVVKIPRIITSEEAAGYRQATMRILEQMPIPKSGNYGRPFHQRVNVWREDEKMRELTLHSNLTATATKIAGTPIRLWHDHILAKMPGLPVPTSFHQDLVKWPYDRRIMALSAWIALQDTTVEMGCMSFLPKSHYLLEVADIATSDQEGWRREQPDIEWSSRITIPLQAGDCTFHHGMTFHTAGPNQSSQWRVAHVVIFIEVQARSTMVNDILLQIHLIYLSVFLRPTISVHLCNQFVVETRSVKPTALQPAEFGGVSNISVFIFRQEYK